MRYFLKLLLCLLLLPLLLACTTLATAEEAAEDDFAEQYAEALEGLVSMAVQSDKITPVLKETDISYLDGGSFGIAISIGENASIYIFSRYIFDRSKESRMELHATNFENLACLVKVADRRSLALALLRLVQKTKAPAKDNIYKTRLQHIRQQLEELAEDRQATPEPPKTPPIPAVNPEMIKKLRGE